MKWLKFSFLIFFLSLAVSAQDRPKIEGKRIELKPYTPAPSTAPATPAPALPSSAKPSAPSAPKPKIEIKPLVEAAVTQVPYQPTLIKSGLAVEIVVDASGSMNGLLGADTKIKMVQAILKELSSQWAILNDPPLRLGLRTFGATTAGDTAEACSDSQLLFPIAPIERDLLWQNLEKLEAQGSSPLAFALQEAAKDLKPHVSEDRVILLLTDGKDSCNLDPCQAAKEIYSKDQIVVHVVAFDVAQSDEPALQCIAQQSRGAFLLARTREELGSALDEAIRSTLPYNLRLKVLVGGSPLPSTVTVYKAGTQQVMKKEQSFGIELFRLDPGAYDILVEYSGSIEKRKPSKILKGVELTQTGKVEQEIRFDLASITVAGFDAQGQPTQTAYSFYKSGKDQSFAELTSDGSETTLFIAPGNYDVVAHKVAPEGQEMTIKETNIALSMEQGTLKRFAFQTGSVVLKGETSQKVPVALNYRVTKSGEPSNLIMEGQVEKTGGKIELPPGLYDIAVEAVDPTLESKPKGKLSAIAVEGGAIQEKLITLVVGTLNIKAVKAGDEEAPSKIFVIDPTTKEVVAEASAPEGKGTAIIPPGKYDVEAQLISDQYTEGPRTQPVAVEIKQDQASEITVKFLLGTLKLLGRDSKERQLETTYFIYEGATEHIIAKAGPKSGWSIFDLSPGNYDVKGVKTPAQGEAEQIVWQRDIDVTADSLYVREVVFTNAKLRLIGRGTNNEIIPVDFKIYKYGSDRPVLSGSTGEDWQSFDLNPDQYYVEASYLDPDSSQVLKKWVTLKIGENEFVERELRF